MKGKEGEARGHTGCPNSHSMKVLGGSPRKMGFFLLPVWNIGGHAPNPMWVLWQPKRWQEDAVNVLDQDSQAPSTPSAV